MVGRPSLRAGSGREALVESREWSGGPPGGPEVVEGLPEGPGVVVWSSQWTRNGGKPSQRAGCGRDALPEGRGWSGGSTGRLGVVRMHSWRDGSDREALLEGCEWSGGPPGGLAVFESPPGGLGVVGCPSWWTRSGESTSRRVGSGKEAIPVGWETLLIGQLAIPVDQEWLGVPPR